MPNWKDLFTNRERRPFPEVVVPLARSQSEKSAQDANVNDNVPSDNSLDRASVQEKGAGVVPKSTELTLESLRAEIEAEIEAAGSGHDTAYDRTLNRYTSMLPDLELGI